jgi:hypothetical protein
MQDEYAIWPMQGLPIVLLWNARTKLSQVEAKNSAPKDGHLGQREPVVQPATRDLWILWPVLFWEKGV